MKKCRCVQDVAKCMMNLSIPDVHIAIRTMIAGEFKL